MAKVSGKEHRAVTIPQFLLQAVLRKKDVGGLGLEESWGKQICPVSEPRVWDANWKNGELRADFEETKGWTISRTGQREVRKAGHRAYLSRKEFMGGTRWAQQVSSTCTSPASF